MSLKQTVVIMSLIFLLIGGTLPAINAQTKQDMKSYLFTEAEQAMLEADNVGANILAPKSYSEAMENYQKAEADFKKGKNLDDIRKNLKIAVSLFKKAKESTKLANIAFGISIQARNDAISSDAPKFATNLWQKSEEKFSDAASTLEEGNAKDAKKKAGEAEKMFRDAELQAIKVNYLNETYALLKEAEKVKAKEYAPITLQKSQDLVKRAEKELNENRYDTDVARILARQAKREAQHAIYLAKTIKALKDNKNTLEDLMLLAEVPIIKISTSMNMIPSFESGLFQPTEKIISNIVTYQSDISNLKANLFYANQRIGLLDDRNSELEINNINLNKKLGTTEKEKSALAKRLEIQAKIREQFNAVVNLFDENEAIVIREGNDFIIRLTGLSFPVGKATIEPRYHDFLDKLVQAIGMFPNSTITITGHTDSYGSDETNLTLSVNRAEAVTKYISTTMNLDPSSVEAVGYGESRPIATNETEEGRAKNRRIEVIIHPKLEESL